MIWKLGWIWNDSNGKDTLLDRGPAISKEDEFQILNEGKRRDVLGLGAALRLVAMNGLEGITSNHSSGDRFDKNSVQFSGQTLPNMSKS